MADLQKPSRPVVHGKNVSVDSITGAVKYALYKVKYIIIKSYSLADGKTFITKDGQQFQVKDPSSE